MSDRRTHDRPESPDRRTFPRPPLWLNLILLLLGIGGTLYARYHREQVSKEFAGVITEQQRTPADVRQIKDQLSEMNLSREALQKELQSRRELVSRLKSEDFYLSIDTQHRKLRFYYGDTILREADLTIGEKRSVTSAGKSWTFIPVKGSFPIQAKIVGYDWQIPEWVYAMNNQPVPPQRPVVHNGLGEYVLFLPDGYTIHTPPSEESPLKGAKPGSYMVQPDVMRAIWPRIHPGKTQVFIF